MADNIMRNQAHVKDVSKRKGIADNIGDMIIDVNQNIFFKTAWETYKQMPVSVNGTTPDDTGNITISTGGGSGSASFGIYNAWWSTPYTVLTILTNQATDNAISSVTVDGQAGTLGTPVTIGSGMQTQSVTFATAIDESNAESATIALTTGTLTIGLATQASTPTPTTQTDIYGATLVETGTNAYTLEIFVNSTWYDDGGDVFTPTGLGENTWTYDNYTALSNNMTMVAYTTSGSEITLSSASVAINTTLTPSSGSSPIQVPLNYTNTTQAPVQSGAILLAEAYSVLQTNNRLVPSIDIYIPSSVDNNVVASNYTLSGSYSLYYTNVTLTTSNLPEGYSAILTFTLPTTATIAQVMSAYQALSASKLVLVQTLNSVATNFQVILSNSPNNATINNDSNTSAYINLNATDKLTLSSRVKAVNANTLQFAIYGQMTTTAASTLGTTATQVLMNYNSNSGGQYPALSFMSNVYLTASIIDTAPLLTMITPDATTIVLALQWVTPASSPASGANAGLQLPANPGGADINIPAGTVVTLSYSATVAMHS